MPERIILFFAFPRVKNWAEEYGYDLLPFPEAAHGLITGPEKDDVGETIAQWLSKKIADN